MYKFLTDSSGRHFREHHNKTNGEDISAHFNELPPPIYFKKRADCLCVDFKQLNQVKTLYTSYYIGVDWITRNEKAIYVEPKLNDVHQINYLLMLFSALKHPEVAKHTEDLFEVKFNEPYIEIQQQQDLLTPLLVVQFLQVVKDIVRKGLKKSYYKVEQNLYGKVKGKVMVGQTIKHNLLKNKPLYTSCSYDEFGLNGLENRLLKKALVFVQRYLPSLKNLHADKYATDVFNYIMPSFANVSEEVDLNDIQHTKVNAFYKEYSEGIRLAKLILKQFGYNITNTQQSTIKTPPFWIDMSKLFELYVLGLLKDRFGNKIHYHYTSSWNELDYLLNTPEYKMVIDAKYKTRYQDGFKNEDIRQISGYARLKSVYDELGKNYNEVIDCLIIYPDQAIGNIDLVFLNLKHHEIEQFTHFYKLAVKLPII